MENYRFIGNDMFADGEAHAGASTKGGGDGARDEASAAHDVRRCLAQSSGHFPMIGSLADLGISVENQVG